MDKSTSVAGPFKRRYFAAFAHRSYRLFWIGITLSYIGFWMQQVAQGWLVLRLTDSPLMLGMNSAMGNIPFLVFALYGGAIADRINRRHMVIFWQISSSVLMVVMGVLVFSGSVQIWHVFVISFFAFALAAMAVPARQALLPDLVPKESLVSAVSMWDASFHGARVLGPAMAGLLVNRFGEESAFGVYAVGSLAFACSLMLVPGGNPPPCAEKSWKVHRQIVDGFATVRKNREAYTLVLLTAVTAIFASAYMAILPYFARDILGGNSVDLGTLMMATGIGAVIGVFMISALGDFRYKGVVVLVSFALWGVVTVFFSQSHSFILSAIFLAMIGFFWGIAETLANVILLMLLPPSHHGRVMSMLIWTWGMGFLGSAIVGYFAQVISVQWALTAVGVYITVATIVVFALRPSLRKI